MKTSPTVDRWMREVARLRERAGKLRGHRWADPSTITDVLNDTLAACTSLLGDLAEAGRRAEMARAEAQRAAERIDERLQHLPIACVTTDAHGVILEVNPAAAALLNLSVKYLRDRLLLHFAEDRESFSDLLEHVQRHDGDVRVTLAVRPRERRPRRVSLVIVRESVPNPPVWQWYLLPMSSDESEGAAPRQWSENGAA
jgi:PAS domain-containing protein